MSHAVMISLISDLTAKVGYEKRAHKACRADADISVSTSVLRRRRFDDTGEGQAHPCDILRSTKIAV